MRDAGGGLAVVDRPNLKAHLSRASALGAVRPALLAAMASADELQLESAEEAHGVGFAIIHVPTEGNRQKGPAVMRSPKAASSDALSASDMLSDSSDVLSAL